VSACLPFISIIIPVRNEEKCMAACLACILEGEYPLDRLEILVVDGSSDDRTRQIVADVAQRAPAVRLLDNPARVVPHAMNIGIRAARGEIVVRMDAHARYASTYLVQLVGWMDRLGADNVGGVCITQPASQAPQSRAVAVILSHAFGIGSALFRLGSAKMPVEVDTVPFGCYRRETFERIGLYDEIFVRNQDDELNARLKRSGGRIFLVPEIRIDYIARESLRKAATMLYQYGYFKPLVAIKLGHPATFRQLAPPAFVLGVLGLPLLALVVPAAAYAWLAVLGAHTAINLCVSIVQARRHGWALLPHLLCGFALAHLAYGLGYLKGLLDFGLRRVHLKEAVRDAPLSR
jgi:glycosyltransferase involved in cell wall biosynthesis